MAKNGTISIACASAFWGDTPFAVRQLLTEKRLDYIALDYLSEVTMALLVRGLKKDPLAGYTADFLSDVIEPHLAEIQKRGIKLITNAGGMNPTALAAKIRQTAAHLGIKVNVISVEGDDLRHLKLGEHNSVNAYLGAPAVVQALKLGADIVITGRVVDSALVSGPLAYEFDWSFEKDYDQLAQASLAGHVIECGTQCSGGNFTDWKTVPRPENVGFPVVRFEPSGKFTVTKPPGTGGLVTPATVAEQIVYEIGDPGAYILPDVVCDFRNVQLTAAGSDEVVVEGARGHAPGDHYKVSSTLQKGFRISTTAFIGGGEAKAKARAVGETILRRCVGFITKPYDETLIETIGDEQGALLRISAAHPDPSALEVLAKEIAPAGTSLAPGLANLLGGRAHTVPRIAFEGFLIAKTKVEVRLDDGSRKIPVAVPAGRELAALKTSNFQSIAAPSAGEEVPLERLAYARSGDKGNHVNVGVIARRPEYLPWIKAALTPDRIATVFADDFDQRGRAVVHGWELPGFSALNFLIHDCLGGGGSYSLRIDPQGKAFAQRLLQTPVTVPKGAI